MKSLFKKEKNIIKNGKTTIKDPPNTIKWTNTHIFIIPESKKDKVNDKESILNKLVEIIFPYLGRL